MIPAHNSTDSTARGQGFINREFRLLDRYELQTELVTALDATEFHSHLAGKVFACHKKFRGKRCDGNHTWAKANNSCSVRMCPHCAHRRARIMAARVQKFIVGKTNLRYLVLAERNSSNLKDGVDSLWAAWMRLRRSVHWKRKVRGSIAVLEVTYNRDSRTWHPHLNVLMDGDYFPFEQVNLLWQAATAGNGRTSHISAADEGTVRELIKYTLKVAERKKEETGVSSLRLIVDRPEAIDEFLSALYGARLIRTYGTFFGLNITDEGNPEEECPDCGSKTVVDLGPISNHQLYFDFEKECFRVRGAAEFAAARARYTAKYEPQGEKCVHEKHKPGTRQNRLKYFEGREETALQRMTREDWKNGVKIGSADPHEKIFQAVQSRKQLREYELNVCTKFRKGAA